DDIAAQFPGGPSEEIFYNPSTSGLSAVNVQDALDQTDLFTQIAQETANTREANFTGLVFGGVMSSDVISGTSADVSIDISAGEGKLSDSWTDPLVVEEKTITWDDQFLNFTTQELTDTLIWRIYVDETNIIQKQGTAFTLEQLRTNIVLGNIESDLEGNINVIINAKIIHNNVIGLLIDNYITGGAVRILNGRYLTASEVGTPLQVKLTSGTLFIPGVNWETDPTNPNTIEVDAIDPVNIAYVDSQSSTYYKKPNEEVDAKTYDPDFSGVLEIVTTNKFTIQKVFLALGSLLVIQYGPTEYNTLNKALDAVANEVINWIDNVNNLTAGLTHTGWLVIGEDVTDLADTSQVRFIRVSGEGVEEGSQITSADNVIYDNTTSLLEADNVQDAIDELDERLDVLDGGTSGEIPETVSTFIELTDTPNDYTGFAESLVRVKAGENGLEFVISGGVDYIKAEDVSYDNTASELNAVDVQLGIDELQSTKISQLIQDSNPTLSGDLVTNSNSIFLNGVSGQIEGIQWHVGDKTTLA
ncbi:MAG: hypothetical protein ACC656_07255, partial [Candidatus Heimdallarchaeota archaeon]